MANKAKSNKGEGLTISDLPETEKTRITHLVDRLMTLGREHEEVMSSLSNERARHAVEIDAANRRIEEELGAVDLRLIQQSETIQHLREQRAAAFSMLQKYQDRLEIYEASIRTKQKSEEEAAQRTVRLLSQVESLEKVIEKQRSSIIDMETANYSTKKSFQETIDMADQRNRRLVEETELLKEQVNKNERRAQGLESAITGLTKQIANLNKTGTLKDDTIADLNRALESKELALTLEREATSAARAESAAFAAAAATATASAAAAVQKSLRREKKEKQPLALSTSRTSSEMLLFDTIESMTFQSKSEQKKPSTRRGKSSLSRGDVFQGKKQSQFDDLSVGITRHVASTREAATSTIRKTNYQLGEKTILTDEYKGSHQTSIKKMTRESPVHPAESSSKGSLAIELGKHRHYDPSLLYLLESM